MLELVMEVGSVDYVQAMFKLCSSYVQTMFIKWSNYVHTMLKLRSNYVHTMFKLCSNYVHTMFKLCSCYVQTYPLLCLNWSWKLVRWTHRIRRPPALVGLKNRVVEQLFPCQPRKNKNIWINIIFKLKFLYKTTTFRH